MSRLVNSSSKLKFKGVNNYNSYFYYTRNHVSYPRSDGEHTKHMFDGRTSVCCKKLG